MDNYVVEVCPYCDREIEIRWDTKEFGYKVFCPHCGNAMMLCDECMHPDGEFDDRCNWNRITGRCKHNTLPESTELDRLTHRIEPNVGNGIGIERVCHYGKDRSEVGCYGCVERTKCNHDLFQRLALYEDTGLSPEQVEAAVRILKWKENFQTKCLTNEQKHAVEEAYHCADCLAFTEMQKFISKDDSDYQLLEALEADSWKYDEEMSEEQQDDYQKRKEAVFKKYGIFI